MVDGVMICYRWDTTEHDAIARFRRDFGCVPKLVVRDQPPGNYAAARGVAFLRLGPVPAPAPAAPPTTTEE